MQPFLSVKNCGSLSSLSFLNDSRLVYGNGNAYSADNENKIVIYRLNSTEPDIIIKDIDYVYSVCGLKNGNLASGGGDNNITIWEVIKNRYKKVYTLRGHTDGIFKIKELEDGNLSSCSGDWTIKIWDKNYKCIKTLTGHRDTVSSIIEVNNYIVSATESFGCDENLILWDKSTYQCITTLKGVHCNNSESLAKLKEDKVILGSDEILFIVDILSFQCRTFEDERLGFIFCVCPLGSKKVLVGDENGMICCFDESSDQIIFTQQNKYNRITVCIVESKEKKLFSSLDNGTIINFPIAIY